MTVGAPDWLDYPSAGGDGSRRHLLYFNGDHFRGSAQERNAFLSSSLYIVATLCGAAYALYPTLLPASGDPEYSLTIQNAAAGPTSLSIGLIWWTVGMIIAVGYFVLVYTMFKGKVVIPRP